MPSRSDTLRSRGFERLRPENGGRKKTLMEQLQEEGYKPTPAEKPVAKPEPKPAVTDPYAGLSKDEVEEMKRRERVKTLLGGR